MFTDVRFKISRKDLDDEIEDQIRHHVKDYATKEQDYIKLDPVFIEVIARITRQAASQILPQEEDTTRVRVALNSIRELVSCKWEIVE